MALGLQTETGEGGDFNAVCKFDARAGRFFRVDRTQTASGWETENVEITNGFTAVFDLDQVEVGYILFAAGVAPQWSMVPLGSPLPAKPSDQHKQGFRILLKLGKASGGDVREFASCAKVVINALDQLHNAYEAERAKNPGKLPVVSMTGSTPVVSSGKAGSSTNYMPQFKIVKWVDRPDDLPLKTAAKAAPADQAEPAAVEDDGQEF